MAISRTHPPRRVSLALALSLCLVSALVGVGIGWWAGAAATFSKLGPLLSAIGEASPKPPPSPLEIERGADREPEQGMTVPFADALALAMRVRSLESLLAELDAEGVEPSVMLERVISQASDEQLRAAIGAATRMSDAELGQIRDMPGYANRLAEIAMAGIVEPEEEDPAMGPVFFGLSEDAEPGAAGQLTSFPGSSGRIYAIFPMRDFAGDRVMIKWFRTDEPKILLFRPYTVRASAEQNWVWLDHEGRWERGQYQVDVYSGNESLEPVARGRFRIE